MPGLDELFDKKIQESSGSALDPLETQSFQSVDPFLQDYNKNVTSDKSLAGLMGANVEQGGLGDVSYFDEGRVYNNGNLDKARADNQTWYSKWGNAAIKMVPGVVLGVGEIAGHLLDLENYASMFTGAQNNYDNWFSSAMRSAREGLDEAMPVYQQEPGKAWAPGDTGWWANNVTGLVESMAEFFAVNALTGGMGGAISRGASLGRTAMLARNAKLAKGIANLTPDKMLKAQQAIDKGTDIANVFNKVAQAGSAFEMGVAVSSMNATGTYQEVYNTAIKSINPLTNKPYTEEEAVKIASDSAATSFNTGLVFNSVLNYTSITPFFRGKAIPPKSKLGPIAGESSDDMLTRLKDLRANPDKLKEASKWYDKWYVDTALEMGQEAVEEYGEALAGKMGVNQGIEKITGEKQEINYFSEDMLVAAGLGMLGGGVGKGFKAFFDRNNDSKLQDSLIKEVDYRIQNIETYKTAQTNLAKAKAENNEVEVAKAEEQLFTNQLFDAIVNDNVETFVQQMEEIGKLSREDAKAKGFFADETDNLNDATSGDYRVKANAAIDLVKKGKVIATAVQQDGYLQDELKPLVLREQLSAAFNEHVADGLKRDIAALEMKEVKYDSSGEPIAQPWVYGGNLQAKVDAIDSLVFREEQAIEQGKGNPKTLEHLKSKQSLFKAQLQQHINDQTAVGKKYDPTLSRQGLNYLQLSRKYRELMSVETAGLNSRNKLTKLISLENQKATVEHLKNVERRLPKKVEIANKAKELMGKFFSLPSDADPQSKKEIMDQLNGLLDSGAMQALDYVDPNDESGQSEFDTRQEILEEILGSMQSPEDLKRFIDEADLGSTEISYDENNQPVTKKVDDGSVQHRRKVFDENGNPVLEDVASTDVNGNPITTQRQALENVGSKTTLADLFGRMQDINNRSNELKDTGLASDEDGKVNPFKALLLAMSETFDEDVKQTIAENKDKVKIAREKEKAKREEFAKDTLEQNLEQYLDELGIIEDLVMPNEIGKIQEKFTGLANRLLEMYGPAYLPVIQKLSGAINAMIPQFDTRYSNMSINQILEGVGGINENFVLPVVFSTRILYKGKPIVRTEDGGYHYGTNKEIGEIEGEKLKHVPGTIEVINGKAVFIPESAIGLDDKADYAVELSADALTKPLSELNIGVKMQETYDIQLAVSEDGNTALINFGGKSFKLSDVNPENDFFYDESGEFLTGLYMEDADGIGHIITDPAMLTDLINIIGSYAMLFQEYAENNFTVSVVNVFGKKSIYKVVDFNAVKPEESIVVTDTGVDISHHNLKSEGGALTIKGRVLNELKRKFINDVVKKLSDEISQQQTIEPTETEGSQEDGQRPESQVNNQDNQRIRESQERVRRKEFTEEQKSKIDKYRNKYESKIKDLINSQNAEGLQQEFDKFEKISNYSGTSDEVIAQVEAAKAAMKLIYNGMKVINKSLEERGNDAVNNSKKVPTDKLDTKGFESANPGKDLYHDENGTDESPSILNNDFKIVTDGLEVKTAESLATPKQNDMAVVSDGEYTYVINYNNGKWEPVIVTDNNGSAAIVQKDSNKVKYIKPDGSQGEWEKSKFESNLSKFLAKPDITVHIISRDDAGKVWREINDKLKNPKDTKSKQTQTIKKDLQVAGTRKDGVKLFTTPNVTESWQPPGKSNKYTVVSLNSTNTPTGITINDEFITQQGLDMLHNPNVTAETHFIRFKAIENNWWKSQSDDTKKLRNELTPIYVELVDKLTGESIIVSRLASASKNGNLLPERSAILEALDKGQEVTAEIANEYGQNRMFSIQRDGYMHVLNVYDDSGEPVFYSMSDPNNGLINTWQLTKDGSFSKENKPSEIVLLTTKGMDANKSFGKSEKLQIDTKNQMSNADPKVRTALKQQLPAIDISNFTEGQIMMPMVTPAGVVTVVPLSTAFVTNDIINDFFLSPLKKMNGNAVSADDFDSFVENLRQIISIDSKPSKDPQSFFQVDKVIKDGKMIGSNIKFWSKKHNSYLTVALSNREGITGLINSLQNNLPIKATITTVNGRGDFKGSKNTVDITSDDLMEVMAERKMNVQRDKLNSKAKFSITNPTTGEVQEFNSYNEFVMGLPSTDNKPNMIINDKKKSGPMTSILNHNLMNNNGTVFNGAGVVMNNLSVEVKKEKKQQQQQQKPAEKKQERRTVTPKPVQGKSFNEVKKIIDEIQQVPKTIAVVGDISKNPAEDAAGVITGAFGENPTLAKQFLNNFGIENKKITINDNVKISGTTVELLGKVDENTDEFKKLLKETYRYGLDLVVNGKLVASSINNKGKYVNLKTGQVYKRATSVIKDKEFEGNALSDTAVEIGNKVDTILRKAFTLSSKGKFIYFTDLATGNLISKEKLQSSMESAPENFPTTDVNEMYEFLKEVHDIRLAMEKRNELPFADNILLHNDELGIAGTVDLLTVDPSGTIRIYDFKTMRGNKLATTYEGKSESKYDTEFDGMSDRQYHQQQLSMYRILLANTYGLVADNLAVMPIEVKYEAGDSHSKTLKRATDPETNSKWIIHEPLDTVKGVSINYPDGYLPIAEEVQEEEDAKNYEAEKQESEKKPLVNKKSDTNGQVIEKTDAKLKGTKKSLSADDVISNIDEQGKQEEGAKKETPKSLRPTPKVEQQATSTFDPNDTEISKGALVNYNGKPYILWGTTANGSAKLYDASTGEKYTGTPKLDKLTSAGGKYKSITHSNGTDYIYVDGNIISLATGLPTFTNPTDPQRQQILNKFGITETSQSQETTKTTPTEPTPSAFDSLFSLGDDTDDDMSFEDTSANNPINLQEFEEAQFKPDSRTGKVYTSAVKAFNEAKENDQFVLTIVNNEGVVESDTTVVKKGDYFIPWVDAFNNEESDRKWNPKDLDKNNNKISLEFNGIFDRDVPFRRSNSTEAVIDTKKAGKWLRSRGIPFDETTQILRVAQNANNAKVHGYFHNGLVYISSTAEVGTEYHEAFHAVFRTWNNDAQQRQLLDEAKSIYPAPTKEELQDLKELYPNLNDSQIEDLYYEEVLSEKFRQYVITNQKPRTITERIWKFIKDLFNYLKTYTSNKRTIDQLFSNIESGMINKQFTRVSQKAEKMYSRDKKGFTNKTRDHITNAITSAFVQKYDFAKDNGNDKPRASEIFKEIKDDFAIAGVERLAQCTQETDDDYAEFKKIAKNIGYEGEDGIRDLKIKMGAVYANIVKDLQTTNRYGVDSFVNIPGVPNSVGNMMLTLLKQQHIAMPSLANTEKRLGHKITNESFAEVQKQYKAKQITAAEYNEVKKQRQGVLEAITYFGVNNTWNSVKRDDAGFLLPEPGWIELASNQLNEFGLRVKGEISMEEIEAGEEKVYSRDSVQENRADMLSGKLKNFLARVPKPTAGGKILGIIPYNDRQETTSKFQALLTQSGGVSSMSQMLSVLETASKTDPLIKNLYDEILKTMNSNKMEDKLMLNELYTLAAMTYRNFHSFQVRKSWKGGFSLDVINFDSNSRRLTKKLVNDWKNNSYRPGSIYKVNELGEVTVDAVQLSALKAEFDKFNKKPKYELAELTAISNAFKILGVDMSVDTLQKAMQTGIKKSKDTIKGKNVIDYITKDYSNSYKGSGRGFEAIISELSKEKDMHLTDISFFKKAGDVVGQFGGVENMSFTNSQGKNIFPINMHTAFTRNMGALAFYDEGNDIQDAWVDSLALDPKVSFTSSSGVAYESPLYKLRTIPDSIYFTTLDAYKTSGEEHSNTAFQDFNEVNEWLYRLNAYANNGDTSSMYIMAPTIGDRGSNMLVKLPRIGFNKVASEYQSDVKTMLSTMIVQDIKSMQQAYEDIIMNTDKDGNLDTTNLIMYYHYNKDKQGNITPGNWNKFSQLQFLNNTAAGKELIKLFSTTDDQQFLTDIKKADSLVNNAVADSMQYIESKSKDVVQRLIDLKIHEQVIKEKDGKTKVVDIKNPLDLKNYTYIEEFVRDFVTADLIMKNEIKKFTGADQLAYKGGAVEEYSKRMGHIMTPGTESAIEGEIINDEYFVEFGDKPDYTMAIVDDVFSDDDSYNFMMALKDVPGVNSAAIEERINSTYGKNNSNKTDAMGYTTIHKHRAKLLGTRGWTPKHEEAYQNYNKGLEFAIYDKFGNVIQRPTLNPLKTYHDGIYSHNNKNVRVIVKHSTFPLLREFTKSHPRFEKLRARMEAEGEFSGLEPIDEVNHISGVKTGIINSNNTTGAEFDFAAMKPMPFKLETKNQRIPQVIPDRVKVNKLGSQTMKLAPAGLSEFAESNYDIAGVNLKGKEVFDKYQQVLTSMQQNQVDNFYDRMGYNPEGFDSMTSDQKLKFFNNFRRILKTVVEERGLSNNYLKTLDIVSDGKGGFEFAVPMAHPAYSKKFEQMMVSLFKNGPLTLPVNGKAFVQIAEFGTHVKDNSLKFIHSKDGKTIEATEIAIPWEMAEKMGLPRDANGDYDLSKLDQRLLTLVGYRIPTQGKSAMLPMKITRILPKSMGKVILVPGEITAQMGSDFDVDKLYTLMPNYKVEYDAGAKKYNRTDEFGAHIMSRLDYKNKKAFNNTFTPDFIEQLWNNPEMIEDYITDISTDKNTEDLIEAIIKAKEDTLDDMKAMGVSDKPKAVYTGYDINNVANNTQAQLENMLLDLTHGILKSPNHLEDVLSPVDSNTAPNLKKIAAGFIKGEKAMVNKLDANDPFTEITLALRNRVGKAGIGMYAVNMTGAAVAEYSNSQLSPKYEIKANGKVFNMLNRVKDDNGVTVIYSFNKHLTMAVDNAKDPQMAFLNDSLDTATITSLFIRSGIVIPGLENKLTEKLLKANLNDAYSKAKTQEEKDEINNLVQLVKENNTNLALPTAYGLGIIDFMSAKDLDFDGGPVEVATVMRLQPAVLKLTQEMQNNGYLNIEDGVAEMFLKYKSGVKDLKDAKTQAQKFLKDFKNTTMLDYISMVDNIGNQPNLDDPKQLEILGNWALLSAAARQMMQINKVIYNTDVIKNDMSSVAKISEIEDIKESIFENEAPAIIGWIPDYPIASKYSDTLDLMKDFISNFMPQGNDNFSVLGGSVKELLNKKTLKEEHYQELGKFVMPYLLAQPGSPVAKYFTPEFYGPLLYKGLGHKDNIVKQLNTVKTMIISDALPDLKDNKFLTLLDEHPDNKKSYKEEPILALKFETAGKITSSEQDDIIEDFQQLFTHPNEIVRKFADSLLAYNIVAKGLRSGVDSFADLIPIDILNEKIDGKESINEYVRRVANSAFLERVYKSAATFIENNSHVDGLVGWVPSNALSEFLDEDGIESNFLVPIDIEVVEDNKIQLPTYGFMYNDGKKELMKLVEIDGTSYYSSREVINNNGKPVVTTIPIQKGVPYKMLNINNDVQGMVGLAQQIAEENEEYFEC